MIVRFIAVCLLLAGSPGVLASSPRELIQQGNEHFAAERYAEALEAYEQAADSAGEELGAELLHNQAAAHFKLGELDEARELWVRALALKDAAFEARARYDLGNCDYAEALQALQSGDAGGAMERLDRGVQQFRDAIRLDPGLEDARANLELAHTLKKLLEEQATSQPQSRPSSDQSEQGENQDQEQQQQSTQPSEGEQSDQGESGEQEQQEQPPTTQPSTQPQQQPQPSTQPEDESQQPESESEPQPQDSQLEQPPDEQPEPLQMTRQEAERLLQMIRDAEKARRRMLQQREAAKHEPVKRDW